MRATLNQNVKFVSALDYASGSADRNGAVLDTAGYEGVLMVVKFAAIADVAVTSIKAQQGKLDDGSDMADLTGTAQVVAGTDDNKVFVIDLYRPRERYVRLAVDKDGTNATAEDAVYILYGSKYGPVVNDAATVEEHLSPAEGAA